MHFIYGKFNGELLFYYIFFLAKKTGVIKIIKNKPTPYKVVQPTSSLIKLT